MLSVFSLLSDFAWLQHCACHLVFLSIAGAIVTMCQLSSGNWDHSIRPYFSVVVMMWSFLVLINWKKRSNFLAYRWGTKDHKEKETTRPQYHGDYVRDEITQEWIVVYPSWKRYLKYLISFPLTLLFTVGTLIVILLVHANRDLMLAKYFQVKTNGSEQFQMSFSIEAIGRKAPLEAVHVSSEHLRDPIFWVITAGLPAALGLSLPLLNLILMRISVALNNFENYRTESEYRNHLIIKVFSFRFVCYFATLYYYSFMSIGSEQEIESGILRVGTSVFIYITVTHWWGLFLQIQFPVLIHRWRMRRLKKRLRQELMMVELEEAHYADMPQEEVMDEEKKDRCVQLINKRLLLDQAQDELWREVMMPMHDSFPEYIQAIVQFAYVTCFSVVLPITPIICLMNHVLSMRFDAYKVCRTRNRPLASKTGGLGVWEHVLHIVSVIAVLTNCFLMGFTNSQLRWIGDQIGDLGLFCVVVGWEHVMLLIKYIMTASISTLPRAVKDEMKRDLHKMERMQSSNMRAKTDRRTKHSRQGSQTSILRNDEDCDSNVSSVERTHHGNVYSRAAQGVGLSTIPSEDTENCSTGSENQKQCQDASKATGNTESKKGTLGRVPFQRMTVNTQSPSIQSRFVIPTPCHLQMDADTTTTHSKKADEKPSPFSVFLSVVPVQTPSAVQSTPTNSIEVFFCGKGLDEDESLATKEASVSSFVCGGRNNDLREAEAAARITSRLQSLESRTRAHASQQEMPKDHL